MEEHLRHGHEVLRLRRHEEQDGNHQGRRQGGKEYPRLCVEQRRRPRHRETREAEGPHAEKVAYQDDEPERQGAHAAGQLRVCPQLRRVRRQDPLAKGKCKVSRST